MALPLRRLGSAAAAAVARPNLVSACSSAAVRAWGSRMNFSSAPAAASAKPESTPPPTYQGPRQTRVFHDIPNRADVKLEEGLEAKFAVINIKSKQYKVTKDDLIVSDKVHDIEPGSVFEVDEVHLLGTPEYTVVGRPFVKDAKVKLQVEEQTKDAKVIILKKKRRKGYKRKQGFRREVTIFRVLEINNA